MGQAERSLFDMLADARLRLRERTLPTLTAALILQVRLACATDRFDLRALSSAFGIVVLLILALVAATADALVAAVVPSVRDAARMRVRFGPAQAPVVALPPPITDEMLADKRGRPLRGAPRTKRLALLERQRAEQIALALAAAERDDPRVIQLPPLSPRLVAAFARSRELVLAAVGAGVRTYGLVAARSAAAVALVPVPTLPVRWLRIVATTTAMTFVFATAIGTTGIITQQGRIALGASTTLSIIAGEVTAQDPGSSDFKTVSDGTLLRAGMTIRTGGSSYAMLTYFEGSTVSLEPNTTLVIEQLVANPDGSTVISMQQQLGKTWHSVTKLLGQGSKYEVKTPTLTATVRGTAFEVGVAQAATGDFVASVVTTEGAVAAFKPATAADPTPTEVIVPAGFQTQAATTTPVAPPEPAPEPERKVTVTVGTANAVVVDPLGRANGEKDGKLVLQTPGAKVVKVDGKLVITLPNLPDGKISTVIAPTAQAAPVSVATVVAERGKGEARSEETVQIPANATAPSVVTGVEVKRSDSAQPAEVRVLAPQETQDAPAPKVVEAPKPTPRPELVPSLEKKEEPRTNDGGSPGRVSGVADVFVKATLPPLSIEDAARRAEEARRADERAKEEAARRESERRRENEKRAEEARKAEERAKEEAARLGAERRRSEDQARTAPAPVAPPANVVDSILRAVTAPASAERVTQDLRKAEDKAKEDVSRLGDERRRAEEVKRTDDIKVAEAAKRAAEEKAEEIRKAEDKAKAEAARDIERARDIEAKAREQAQRLEAEKRAQAERLLEEFRRSEEKARADAAKRLEEQRHAEERAKADAERRLAQLREEQERAKQEGARAEEERRREEQRRSAERSSQGTRESRFIPPTIDPFPGTLGNRGGQSRP